MLALNVRNSSFWPSSVSGNVWLFQIGSVATTVPEAVTGNVPTIGPVLEPVRSTTFCSAEPATRPAVASAKRNVMPVMFFRLNGPFRRMKSHALLPRLNMCSPPPVSFVDVARTPLVNVACSTSCLRWRIFTCLVTVMPGTAPLPRSV